MVPAPKERSLPSSDRAGPLVSVHPRNHYAQNVSTTHPDSLLILPNISNALGARPSELLDSSSGISITTRAMVEACVALTYSVPWPKYTSSRMMCETTPASQPLNFTCAADPAPN